MSAETPKSAAGAPQNFFKPKVTTYSSTKLHTQTPTLMETIASNPSITASKKNEIQLASSSQVSGRDENVSNSQDKSANKKPDTKKKDGKGKGMLDIRHMFSGGTKPTTKKIDDADNSDHVVSAIEESLANAPSTPFANSLKKKSDEKPEIKEVIVIDDNSNMPVSTAASPAPPAPPAPTPTPTSTHDNEDSVEKITESSVVPTSDSTAATKDVVEKDVTSSEPSIVASEGTTQKNKKSARGRPKRTATKKVTKDNLQLLSSSEEVNAVKVDDDVNNLHDDNIDDDEDDVEPELSPEVKETIERLEKQRSEVLSEFYDYERHEDYNDCHEGSLLSVLLPMVIGSKDEKVIADVMKAYYIQGSHKTLSELVEYIASRSTSDLQELKASKEIVGQSNFETKITRLMDTYFIPSILQDQIKSFGERKKYGHWDRKESIDECNDTNGMSILRWEVCNLTKFDSSRQSICKEASALRKRYGKLIIATTKLIKEHERLNSVSGLDWLVDARNKANQSVEKAKQAKEDSKQRKIEEAIARQKKEEEKEIAKRLKEEKAKAKTKEKEKVVAERASEKAAKEKQKQQEADKNNASLQKQQSFFSAFVKKPKAPEPAKVTAPSPKTSGNTISQKNSIDKTQLENFSKTITSNMKTSACQADLKRRFRDRNSKRSNKMRKPVKLTVTVQVPVEEEQAPINAENGDGAFAREAQQLETYSELKEVALDSRMKFLEFYENNRPPYFGTFSKRSAIISGRGPFKKDDEKLNYEDDSEAEWEDVGEEENGEDLGESEGEDDGEPDDLVYDDFFKRDDEETSDLDSDGEGMATVRISRKHQKAEYVGPRYIRSHSLMHVEDEIAKKDILRLRSYPTITYKAESILGLAGNDFAAEGSDDDENGSGGEKDKRLKDFPEVAARLLAKFITGKKDSKEKLVESFYEQYHEQHLQLSKGQIRKKLSEIAAKIKHPDGHGTNRWVVHSELTEVLEVEGIDNIPFTPLKPVRQKKERNTENKEKTEQTNNADVTNALMKVMEKMSDPEAAKYICRNWDVILRTRYPWSLLQPRLESMEWEQMAANSFSYAYVHVPSWAKDKFEASGCKPGNLIENRDYFVDQEDIKTYILKYGTECTDAPPTPRRRRKSEVLEPNSLEESPFKKAYKIIVSERKARELEAQLESHKRKIENLSKEEEEEGEEADETNTNDVDGVDESASLSLPSPETPSKCARLQDNKDDNHELSRMEQEMEEENNIAQEN